MKYLKIILSVLLVLIFIDSKATHIRAGEIIARRVDNVTLTYQFTFYGYRDQEGVIFGQGRFDYGDGEIYGDDEDEPIPWNQARIEDLGNGVERWEFTLTHTYQAANNYLVSYSEDYRNDNILNISGSVSTAFHVETLIVIDPFFGVNNSPVFSVPPIDQGVVGVRFEHNPGAFDPDGDSLSFYFVTPQKDKGTDVDGYRSLIDPSFYDDFSAGSQDGGQPTLTLDPVTGTMVWDAPGGSQIPDEGNGEYNVAFVVEEFRQINGQWRSLGFVTRDMQIIIWDFENEPPELEIPADTCVVAGDTIFATVIGTDPDGDDVILEAFGGPFEVNPPNATFEPDTPQFQNIPAILEFEWTTVCGHVRTSPYQVQFKATDRPSIPNFQGNPPGLVDFETWSITVVGPQPTGLTAETQTGRSIQLNWEPYSCSNADSMQVWRRVDSFEIDASCEQGMPENAGYELIETLEISEIGLLDDNNGVGLAPGSVYCYRLVATFPPTAGGLSIVSEEACDSLLIDVPVITNVNTLETSENEGILDIRWTPPYEIESTTSIEDFTYTVLRTEGRGPFGVYSPVVTQQSDTFFIDSGLNTDDLFHAYKIVLHDDTGQALDTSAVASSIRLDPIPQIGSIQLNWEGNTPWSITAQDYPKHYIYRDNVDENDPSLIVLIDSVDVTIDGLTYLDDGLEGESLNEEIEYCYWVSTQGTYGNDLLPEPLINNTQIVCLNPNDSIPPCTPIEISFDSSAPFNCENIVQQTCDFTAFENWLIWEEDGEASCDDDIRFYRIYYSPSGDEETFVVIDETTTTSFVHTGLNSYVGCYRISSVDRSGNESELSEVFCNDNCPNILFPNVFTPNGDGINDVFRPYYEGSLIANDVGEDGTIDGFQDSNCPRFVRDLSIRVFNRAGTLVFDYNTFENENSILINWEGKSSSGRELPAGVYYYSAEVTFIRLNPEDEKEVYNGWVQILK